MNYLQIDLENNETLTIKQIVINAIGRDIMVGTDEAIFNHWIKEEINGINNKYGTYRPIQIIEPLIEDNRFAYSIFVDMGAIGFDKIRNTAVFKDKGILFFDSAINIALENIIKTIKSKTDWSICRKYYSENY